MRTTRAPFAITSLVALSALFGASCKGAPGPVSPAAAYRSPTAAPQPGDDGALGASPRVSFAVAAEPPLALTASDGTGLRLAKLQADAVVDGPLAFTELHLAFDNPEDRVLEGTFRIALPQGASIGRFAMKVNGEWQEGEVVEKEAARRAYEDFLHRKQDPALMEKSAGNEFSARVFPIPARGTKEIVVAYTHEVHDRPYVLPLKGLPSLGALDVDVHVVGAKSDPKPLSARGVAPSSDYVADVRAAIAAPAAKVSGVRSGELAILRVRPETEARPDPLDRAIVLVDTSASRVLGFDEEIAIVERVVKKAAEANGSVVVAAFDQSVAPIYEGAASELRDRDLARLRDRGALGASDLDRALAWAKDRARASHAKRVVVVTDGVATAGATEPKKLAARVASLREAGVERLDAVAIGGIRDDAALARLVRGNLPRDGVIAASTGDGSAAVRRLGEATRSGVAVKVEGATWSWPQRLDGVQAGDVATIFAEVPAQQPVKIALGGAAAAVVDLRKTERPLVERAVAQAKIDSMLEREAVTKDPVDLKKSIVALAVRHRIVTPYTSMLVLETEADYARFHIERRSLADVLAIEGGAVKRLHRTFRAFPNAPVDVDADTKVVMKEKAPTTGTTTPPRAPRSRPPEPPKGAEERKPAKAEAKKSMDRADPWNAPGGSAGSAQPAATAAAPLAPPAVAAPPPPPPPSLEPAPRRAAMDEPMPAARAMPESENDGDGIADADDRRARDGKAPYDGRFAGVMASLAEGRADEALANARAWRAEQPGDVLALVGIGEAAEAKGLPELASRAYGSVIDLFPNRADLRRFVGERLDRIAQKDARALDLAIDTYEKAAADRPDHPASHRLLAFALLKKKKYEKAFEAIAKGATRTYEPGRYAGVDRILAEDVGLVGAAWAKAEPGRAEEIARRVREAGGRVEDGPSLRFVLVWETDANDVDFHIHDAKKNHAFFSHKHLRSGGDLYADVTTGYGPECFTIRSPKERRAAPYRLEAHYYSRGPMGYGMGKLEVVEHDGKGNLTFDERPFVVMVDQAYVDLGTVE